MRGPFAVQLLVTLVGAVVLAAASYRLIERPVLRFGKNTAMARTDSSASSPTSRPAR